MESRNTVPGPSPQAGNPPTQSNYYIITADLDDGQPCPPYCDPGVVWQVVRRNGCRTIWRRAERVRS
jgi:hypothetical protein